MSITLSRRRLLRRAGGAAFLGASAAALPLFGTPGSRQTPQSCPSTDRSASEAELTVSNWALYIDPIDHPDSTLQRFQRETGIRVRYYDEITNAGEFFVKVAPQLGACEGVDRDLFIFYEGEAYRMLRLGWLQALDYSRLPNVAARLLPRFRASLQDPGRGHTVPWNGGYTGIAYNAKLVPEVRSYRDLLFRDDLRGRVTMLEEMVDTMPAMLRVAGAGPQDFSEDEWQAAIEFLVDARRRGQIRAFNSVDFQHGLVRGDIAACIAWAPNVLQIQEQYPHIRFVVPEEGMEIWTDCMMIPNKAAHKANAERWINHYYEPEIAARLLLTTGGVSPVAGAREAMERIDPRLAANPLRFPSDELLAKTYQWMPLTEAQSRRYLRDFAQAKGT